MVRRVALAMGVGRDELPDYCQEVFVQVFRYLDRFKGDAAFKTWLYQICLSQVGRLRRRRRFRDALESVFRVTPPAAGVPTGPPLSEAGVREASPARGIRHVRNRRARRCRDRRDPSLPAGHCPTAASSGAPGDRSRTRR
jgi:DNA-directed RNA polymerase specialized sigma24 family protein